MRSEIDRYYNKIETFSAIQFVQDELTWQGESLSAQFSVFIRFSLRVSHRMALVPKEGLPQHQEITNVLAESTPELRVFRSARLFGHDPPLSELFAAIPALLAGRLSQYETNSYYVESRISCGSFTIKIASRHRFLARKRAPQECNLPI
ncbi:hypothetical protein X777_10947 [Ooceraea biroi]|uniref:Uncharacterized protein n=1 Tax=Ooceraea biroi TaxID=2015173 RepID=A0A026W4U1_OOCBI|nr:hypothetical protein X777_10947 [Ooceraea biroi]